MNPVGRETARLGAASGVTLKAEAGQLILLHVADTACF